MTLSFTCPKCGKHYPKIKRQLAGRKAKCTCGHQMRLGEGTDSDRSPPTPSKRQTRKPKTAMNVHYSDLDQILAGGGPIDGPFVTGNQPEKMRQEASAQVSAAPPLQRQSLMAGKDNFTDAPNAKPSSARMTISFLAVVASASLAFWFGSLIVANRFTAIDHILLNGFTESLTNINKGQFGLDEATAGVKVGFIVSGWLIWSIAIGMVLLAVLQFSNAIVQLFIQRQPARWADGLMAMSGVAMLFLFIATLFLHATHTAKLNRNLNQHDSAEAILAGESDLQNVQRLREQYAGDSQKFMTVILVASAIPLTVFGCSMTRLMTRHQ